MKILLDTNIFIWWISNNSQLNTKIIQKIKKADEVYLSIASVWEIIIKTKTGKLNLTQGDIAAFLNSQLILNRFQALTINLSHVLEISNLDSFHADPFDRIIISQAKIENLPVLTSDKIFKMYDIELL